jgi:hypothetical protein
MIRVLAWVQANRVLSALVLLAIAGHLVVRGVYEPENVDDPWTLSFLYNWLTSGVVEDVTFGNAYRSSGGQDGLEHFGKLQALVYGPVLQAFDWNRNVAHAISSLLVLSSIPMWFHIVKRISHNPVPPVVFAVCLFVSEPIVTASNETRPDALAFLLLTGAVYATALNRLFIAGLLSLLAFEVHPMGAISVLYSLAVFLSGKSLSVSMLSYGKAFVRYLAGASVGLAVYVALHLGDIGTFLSVAMSSNGSEFGKSLMMYAFNSNYLRHVPEAMLFGLALLTFVLTGLWRQERATTLLLLAATFSLLLFRRGNHHYMIYYAPVALLVGYAVLSRIRHWIVPVVLFCTLMVAQYGLTAWRNSGFEINSYVEEMRRQAPPTGASVVAEFNGWFAFYDRDFYGAYYDDESFYMSREKFSALNLSEFILIDRLLEPYGASVGWRDAVLPTDMVCEPRSFFTLQGQDYGTFYCAKPATP